MSLFKVNVNLPDTVELSIFSRSEVAARLAAEELVSTAFANALSFWDHNEPISDHEGRPLGSVQLDMPNAGEIELPAGAVEITVREEARQ